MEGTWISLLPPFVSILFALVFRKVIPALLLGVITGVFLLHGASASSLAIALDTYLIGALNNEGHLYIILFTLMIGGMVSLIHYNGGMKGVVELITGTVRSERGAQLTTYFLGLLVFFDDYTNSLIVGNSMRPLTDKYKISREKLAYIIDSTAAPVASIAFVTTWIGAEIGYIQDGIQHLGLDTSAYDVFLHSLKYSFYSLFTLLFVFLIIWTGKDYGPMNQAEKDAKDRKITSRATFEYGKPYLAIIPIVVLVLVTFIGLIVTGINASGGQFTNIKDIIGNADSYKALLYGSASSLLFAIILTLTENKSDQITKKIFEGFEQMLESVSILVLAWTLAYVIKDLKATDFLIQFVNENIDSMLFFQIAIFLLAAITSFASGSSWGTMAILYPLVIPVSWQIAQKLGLSQPESMELLYSSVAFVLSGSVFGDHCSPISDTTILSSMASKCNHISHVRTQIPYALSCAGISISAIIINNVTGSTLVALTAGIGLTFLIIYLLGNKGRIQFGK